LDDVWFTGEEGDLEAIRDGHFLHGLGEREGGWRVRWQNGLRSPADVGSCNKAEDGKGSSHDARELSARMLARSASVEKRKFSRDALPLGKNYFVGVAG
jgi:hypothetical protein